MKMNPLMRPVDPAFFFSSKEKAKIKSAIEAVEKETSAEFRVHLERRQKNRDILEQAREAFERIGMTQTKERNGILIFLCPETRRFAVLGDEAIHSRVPSEFWEEITREMGIRFRQDHFSDGITGALNKIGAQVKKYFPRSIHDSNELSDGLSHT